LTGYLLGDRSRMSEPVALDDRDKPKEDDDHAWTDLARFDQSFAV
jgi:hypothetical protein